MLLYLEKNPKQSLICFLPNKNKTWKEPRDSWMEKHDCPHWSPIKHCKLLDKTSAHNLPPCKRDKDLERCHLLMWPTETLETPDAAELESLGQFLLSVWSVWVTLSKESSLPFRKLPWEVSLSQLQSCVHSIEMNSLPALSQGCRKTSPATQWDFRNADWTHTDGSRVRPSSTHMDQSKSYWQLMLNTGTRYYFFEEIKHCQSMVSGLLTYLFSN